MEKIPELSIDYALMEKSKRVKVIPSDIAWSDVGSFESLAKEFNDGKNYAAPGSTGFRWLESEVVKNAEKEKDIDRSFYDKLVNEAIDAISKYGDFEWFVSDDPYIKDFVAVPNNTPEELPFG